MQHSDVHSSNLTAAKGFEENLDSFPTLESVIVERKGTMAEASLGAPPVVLSPTEKAYHSRLTSTNRRLSTDHDRSQHPYPFPQEYSLETRPPAFPDAVTYPIASSRPLSDVPTVSPLEMKPESRIGSSPPSHSRGSSPNHPPFPGSMSHSARPYESHSSSKSNPLDITPSRHIVPTEPPVIFGHGLNESRHTDRSSNNHSTRTGPVNRPTTPSPHLPNHVDTVFNKSEDPYAFSERTWTWVLTSIIVSIIRQVYLSALFRLPAFYFSRVAVFFEEADMSLAELKRAVFEQALNSSSYKSDTYRRLSDSWVVLIDSLMKGCETLNVISALLLTAILTVLQLDGAATDPITRFSALASMICALLSLLFGCIYIIWLGTMKKLHKAAEIALETKSRVSIFWSTWVMLAMPAIWLGWSILCYIICIMSFLWRTGAATDKDHEPPSDRSILAPRIALSMILALGLVTLALIIRTVTRYGTAMDQAWQRRIRAWVSETQRDHLHSGLHPYIQPYSSDKGSTSSSQRLSMLPQPHPQGTRGHVENLRPMPAFINHITVNDPPRLPELPPAHMQIVTSPVVECEDGSGVGDNVHLVSGAGGLEPCIPEPPRNLHTIFATRLVDLSQNQESKLVIAVKPPLEKYLQAMGLEMESWMFLHDSARNLFRTLPESQITNEDHSIYALISQWNDNHFRASNGQIRLCEEKRQPLDVADAEGDDEVIKNFALYHFSTAELLPYDATKYEVRGSSSSTSRTWDRTQRVDVLGPFGPTSEGGEAGEWSRLSLPVAHMPPLVDRHTTGAPAPTSDANITDGEGQRSLSWNTVSDAMVRSENE